MKRSIWAILLLIISISFTLSVGCVNNLEPVTVNEGQKIMVEQTTTEESTKIVATPQIAELTAAITPAAKKMEQKESSKISKIITDNLASISPIFVSYSDDFIIDDYKKLAIDTLALRKEVQKQQNYFGEKLSNSKIVDAATFSSKDKILYQKYIGYLEILNDMIKSTERALALINDDNSELTLNDKIEILSPAIYARERAYSQIDTIFDLCDEYGDGCGREDSIIEQLKKNKF